jgi:aspartate racemase
MYSVNFAEIEQLQREGRWDEAGDCLADASMRLERGGADMVVLCTNTMHKLAHRIEAATPTLPFLHIADCTARVIKADGVKQVGLLGTRYTMEQDFYKGKLVDDHCLDVHVPNAEDRDVVHDIIFEELVKGEIVDESRLKYQGIIDRLAEDGAEAIILGCTEIGLLVRQEDSPVPLYDTTELHAMAAVDLALQ